MFCYADVRDAERAVAPLAPAADAVILDTTGMTIAAAVRYVLDRFQATEPGRPEAPAGTFGR